jgi:hypothetical protein
MYGNTTPPIFEYSETIRTKSNLSSKYIFRKPKAQSGWFRVLARDVYHWPLYRVVCRPHQYCINSAFINFLLSQWRLIHPNFESWRDVQWPHTTSQKQTNSADLKSIPTLTVHPYSMCISLILNKWLWNTAYKKSKLWYSRQTMCSWNRIWLRLFTIYMENPSSLKLCQW